MRLIEDPKGVIHTSECARYAYGGVCTCSPDSKGEQAERRFDAEHGVLKLVRECCSASAPCERHYREVGQ